MSLRNLVLAGTAALLFAGCKSRYEVSTLECATQSPSGRVYLIPSEVRLSNGMRIPPSKLAGMEPFEGGMTYFIHGYYPDSLSAVPIFDEGNGRPYVYTARGVGVFSDGQTDLGVMAFVQDFDLTAICQGRRVPLWDVAASCFPSNLPYDGGAGVQPFPPAQPLVPTRTRGISL